MSHRNAPLTPQGRLLLCRRIEAGTLITHVAKAMGISRQCASNWWRRYTELGPDALGDRSSRPHRSPKRVGVQLEDKDLPASPGREGRPGPTGHPPRGAGLDDLPGPGPPRPQPAVPHGPPDRRAERSRPGELVHVDIKKLGRIPPGGGHRVHGRPATRTRKRLGYAYLHSAIDDYSRLAYTEVLTDEKGATAAAFWRRAHAWFQTRGISVERVITDNGYCYRGRQFNAALTEHRITHKYCRPYRPQTNGKIERFHRTLLDEWAYVRPYTREADRTRALAHWLHRYNHHRVHTASGGPPISRVTNLPTEHN